MIAQRHISRILSLLVIVLSNSLATNVSAISIFSDNFEGGDLNNWVQGVSGDWANSTNTPINGTRSLQHNLSGTGTVSYIYTQLSPAAGVHSSWHFNLKNSDWDTPPSNYNKFWVYIIANESNLTNDTVDGYAVGVNFNEDTDLLKLWRITDGTAAETIIESSFKWGTADTVGVEVLLDTNGVWEMRYNPQGGFSNMTFAGSSVDTNNIELSYFGLYYKFSSTRAGLLWMDDISIVQDETPSNKPPDLLISPPETTRSTAVGEPISIIVTALETSADSSDVITLNTETLPAGASFPEVTGVSPLTNTFGWTPAQAGAYSVIFNAADKDGTNSITIDFNVIELDPGKIWINEIHYDNTGSDTNEGVEVAGYAGINLNNYQLIFYNGSNGEEYMRLSLSGTINDEGSGFGAVWFDKPGIQNGAPDGIALISTNGGTTNLHQFISYEGKFTATEGPAVGIESVDIGLSETTSTPIDNSLQLTGTGAAYGDFSWIGPIQHSRNILNANQIIKLPGAYITIR